MAISMESTHRFLITITFFALILSNGIAESNSDQITELLELQSRSKSGIIHFNDHAVTRFLTSIRTPRPYSVLLFFDAAELHSKSELHLKELRNEFALLAASFITNNVGKDSRTKLFFCDMEFRESKSSFAEFGINSLPHIRLVSPNVRNLKESDRMEPEDYSRIVESMSEFVESKTNLIVGPIHRPPVVSKNQFICIILFVLIWAPFLGKKVIAGETLLHEPKLWLGGALFVYFFSVSGAMHNIIRNAPMFLTGRNDPMKVVFFYHGSGMQLGAEGFTVGFLYTIVGLLLAIMTHVLVRMKNVTAQRFIMLLSLFVSFWTVMQVVYLDNWKTGYGVHAFWPSSWH